MAPEVEPNAPAYPTVRETQVGRHVRKCSATNRSGKSCNRWAIQGGNVCIMHGGSAPQVRRKAEERLLDMVDPALNTLLRTCKSNNEPALALKAAIDILDRNGLKAVEKVEFSVGESVADILRGRRHKGEQLEAQTVEVTAMAPGSPPGTRGTDPIDMTPLSDNPVEVPTERQTDGDSDEK